MTEHTPPVFRLATEADVPALVALVTSAYRGDASRAGWTTEADLLDGDRIDPGLLHADIVRPRSRVVIAEDMPAAVRPDDSRPDGSRAGGSSAGTLLACAHVADADGAGYFGMFAVDPRRQGGGIGRAVIGECERIVRDDWSLPVMRMTVIDARTELIAWYQRLGYRRTGDFRPFPYGDTRFGIPRRDDLRFEVLDKTLR